MPRIKTDFLVIGSGITGLFQALKLSNVGQTVIVTKKSDYESNTNYAQGGIASVFAQGDKFEDHVKDTLESGAGLCDPEAVRVLVQEGPPLVKELLEYGVPFNLNQEGEFDLHREGGHGTNRIVHAHDRTGHEIEKTLLQIVKQNQNIRILEYHTVVDLITPHHLKKKGLICFGAYVLSSHTGEIIPILAKKRSSQAVGPDRYTPILPIQRSLPETELPVRIGRVQRSEIWNFTSSIPLPFIMKKATLF